MLVTFCFCAGGTYVQSCVCAVVHLKAARFTLHPAPSYKTLHAETVKQRILHNARGHKRHCTSAQCTHCIQHQVCPFVCLSHRVGRVLSFFSRRQGDRHCGTLGIKYKCVQYFCGLSTGCVEMCNGAFVCKRLLYIV